MVEMTDRKKILLQLFLSHLFRSADREEFKSFACKTYPGCSEQVGFLPRLTLIMVPPCMAVRTQRV